MEDKRKSVTIPVSRGRAPFDQHRELRSLGRSAASGDENGPAIPCYKTSTVLCVTFLITRKAIRVNNNIATNC